MHEQREAKQQLPPIQYWFVIRTIPKGTAPLEIKKQWLDIPLPCRRPFIEGLEPHAVFDVGKGLETLKIIDDGVLIDANDAIKALMLFDRGDAGSWWNNYKLLGGMREGLVFQASEGQAISVDVAEKILPGLDQFDELEYWLI